MKPGEFIINGMSSADLSTWIQSRPILAAPKRRIEFTQSMQQDGDLPFDDGVYDNTEMELSIAAVPPGSLVATSNDIEKVSDLRESINDMFDGGTYREAQFYFDPTKIYQVLMTEAQFESKRFLHSAMAASVKLSVLPWKRLIGYEKHQISSGKKVWNPNGKIAYPIITITGTGDCKLTIGGRGFQLKGLTGSIIIDSEVESAYTETTNGTINSNQNDKVYTRDFPYLGSGSTTISWTGDQITKVEIEERWRALV